MRGTIGASDRYGFFTKTRARIKRYNCPTASEIFIVFKSTDGSPSSDRDIRIWLKIPQHGSSFRQIPRIIPICDPMTCPLLAPTGEHGWNPKIPRTVISNGANSQAGEFLIDEDGERQVELEPRVVEGGDEEARPDSEEEGEQGNELQVSRKRKHDSKLEFYSYRLVKRLNIVNIYLMAGTLTQQYFVDSYVSVEASLLDFLRGDQNALRASNHVENDYIQNQADKQDCSVGNIVILPSSFKSHEL